MSPFKKIHLKNNVKLLYTAIFLYIIFCMLVYSRISIYYALLGLNLWFEKMIPSLLPFMIISGIIIRLNLTENITEVIYPFVKLLFRVSHNVCYCMLIGFLCGFPMGARTVSDMYKRNKISSKEAEYLLAFVNNIGPVYFTGFVLPLLGRKLTAPYIAGMYGIPLLYGLILRYTIYKALDNSNSTLDAPKTVTIRNIPVHIDDAIHASLENIITLGGYMILFNLFNLMPHVILGSAPVFLAPLLEISGGLFLLGDRYPLYTLLALAFGGFSCIAQTYTCIRGTDLSITDYIMHKLILTALTALYYLGWYIIFPNSFLI
jgi:hypothetical protein